MPATGKIFKESSNIYQDEAKILFNYYQQAAERIVAEEEKIEKRIAELEEDKAVVEQARSASWKWLLTIVAFFMYWVKKSQYTKQIAAIDQKIDEEKTKHQNIFRDYKVTKMGVAYVPVAEQIKYDDNSFIVDYSGNVAQSQVTLQMSRQNDLLANAISQLNYLSENVPVVETSNEPETIETDQYSLSIQEVNQGDYTGQLDRSMRTIAFCMNDIETNSVNLPLVHDNSEYLNYLQEYATNTIPDNATVIDVFDKERYEQSVKKFQELNKLKDSLSSETQNFEDVLQKLISTVARSIQTISSMKLASTDKMVNKSNNLLFKLLKSPYNHYSPILEAEEIQRIKNERFDYSDSVQGYEPFALRESSRVRYNLLSDMWAAEDGSNTIVPFGVHQIYEEIVAPVVHNLMGENRIERLKIYNQIHDQKVSYVNKWHQDVDAFYRSSQEQSADIINNMQRTLSEYVEAFNTLTQLKKTEETMKREGGLDSAIVQEADNSVETAASFELQASEFQAVQDDFNDFMDRLQEDIENRATEFGHVEYYDAKLQDGYSNKVAVASNEVSQLDERRKPLASINPLLAKDSELPPTPKVEDATFDDLSLNLTALADNALQDLNDMFIVGAPEDNEAKDEGANEEQDVEGAENAEDANTDDNQENVAGAEAEETSDNEGFKFVEESNEDVQEEPTETPDEAQEEPTDAADETQEETDTPIELDSEKKQSVQNLMDTLIEEKKKEEKRKRKK